MREALADTAYAKAESLNLRGQWSREWQTMESKQIRFFYFFVYFIEDLGIILYGTNFQDRSDSAAHRIWAVS